MQFTQGKPEHVAKAKERAELFIGMDGRDGQSPGAVVVRRSFGKGPTWVVHFGNTEFGGFSNGDYLDCLEDAKRRAKQRALKYDPSGELRQRFNTREEQEAFARPAR